MTDRVLELRTRIEKEMLAFDAASVRGDHRSAANHVDRARYLDDLYAAAVPSTPEGAADKIRDAVVTLHSSEDVYASYFATHLNPIARRLARGDRRLADIMTLRAVVSLAKARQNDDDVLPALETALAGVARPVVLAKVGE